MWAILKESYGKVGGRIEELGGDRNFTRRQPEPTDLGPEGPAETQAPTKDLAWSGPRTPYKDVANGPLMLHVDPLVRGVGAHSDMDFLICFSITYPWLDCLANPQGKRAHSVLM